MFFSSTLIAKIVLLLRWWEECGYEPHGLTSAINPTCQSYVEVQGWIQDFT